MSISALGIVNLDHTSHKDISTIKRSRDGNKVLLEFPPESIYYSLSFAKSRAEAIALTRGDNWGCPPEICGI
jgi:hypothetical protein